MYLNEGDGQLEQSADLFLRLSVNYALSVNNNNL